MSDPTYTAEIQINLNDLTKTFPTHAEAVAYARSYLDKVGPDDWISVDVCETIATPLPVK